MGNAVNLETGIVELAQQFKRTVHIAKRARRVRPPSGYHIDLVPLSADLFCGTFHFAGHVMSAGEFLRCGTVEMV